MIRIKTLSRVAAWLGLLTIAFTHARAQQPGLDSAEAIGPFLDGTFPTATPGPGDGWELVDAFPSLTFTQPIQMHPVPGQPLFLICQKNGEMWVFDDSAPQSKSLALDLTATTSNHSDSGMLSFVFHPEFGTPTSPNKDFLYVYYRYTPDVTETQKAYCRLSRFSWLPASNTVDPASEFVLIQQYDRRNIHNGGGLFFGTDGFLYLSIGDEGFVNAYPNTQSITGSLFSGVFRIDVDQQGGTISHPIRRQPVDLETPPTGWPSSSTQGYFIPSDNPFLDPGGSVLEEFWAIGTRSPHRMTQDPQTGDIYLSDVGSDKREEVNLVSAGTNLQWPFREGSIPGQTTPPVPVLGTENPPLYDYPRNIGSSVIGGYVYRGPLHDGILTGRYIFGDIATGQIWSLTPVGGAPIIDALTTLPPNGLFSFALDKDGEIYALSDNAGPNSSSKILRLEQTLPTQDPLPPATLSATGAFSNLANLTPSTGLIPYEPISQLWSDNASKMRWIAIPNDGTPDTSGEQITWNENGNWDFPIGTVIVKQFNLGSTKVETRFLVKDNNASWYGYTYRWNAAQTDADLLMDRVVDTVAGQDWTFPSPQDCFRCHTGSSGYVLGLRNHQLNSDLLYPTTARTANQLFTLSSLGYIDQSINAQDVTSFLSSKSFSDVTATDEEKARSYLDSNCSHCHNPVEGIRDFDFRLSTPLELSGIFDSEPRNDLGIPGAQIIKAGVPSESLTYLRQNTNDPDIRMPPLSRHAIDTAAVSVMSSWIQTVQDPGATPNLPAGLVAWLPFEETSGALANDASGKNHPGQLLGSLTQTLLGRSGAGIEAPGGAGDYLSIPHAPDLNLGANGDDFSVSFWVNLTETATGNWRVLAKKGDNPTDRAFAIYLTPNSNKMQFVVSTTQSFSQGGISDHALAVGQWTHVAFVKEGLFLQLYIDGLLDSTRNITAETIGNTGNIYLGGAPTDSSPTNAQFDSFQIYDRPLTSSDINDALAVNDTLSISTPQAPLPPSDLYLKFDESMGMAALDSSSNGHLGTLGSGATRVAGLFNGGIEADGTTNGISVVQHDPNLNIGANNEDFTVAFWMNLQEDPTGNWRVIAKKGALHTDRGFALYLRPDTNQIHHAISTTSSFSESSTTTTELTLGTWAHLTYIKRGNSTELYINGALVSGRSLNGTSLGNTGDFFIGGAFSDSNPTHAQYDDFRVFRQALGLSEIQALLEPNEEETPPSAPTANLAFRFDETSGLTASDDSGNAHVGTLSGGASFVTGKNNNGLLTDGVSGRVEVPHSSTIDLGANDEDFTVGFWLNLQEDATGSWRLVAKKGSNHLDRGFAVYLRPESNVLNYTVSTTASFSQGGTSISALTVGEWTHVMFLKRGNSLEYYRNGILDHSRTLTAGSIGSAGPVYLGSAAGDSQETHAIYDDFQLFDRALTNAEMISVFLDDGSGQPSALLTSSPNAPVARATAIQPTVIGGPSGSTFRSSRYRTDLFAANTPFTVLLVLPEDSPLSLTDGFGTLLDGRLTLTVPNGAELAPKLIQTEDGFRFDTGEPIQGDINGIQEEAISDFDGAVRWTNSEGHETEAMLLGSRYTHAIPTGSGELQLLGPTLSETAAVQFRGLNIAGENIEAIWSDLDGTFRGRIKTVTSGIVEIEGVIFERQNLAAGSYRAVESEEMGQIQIRW